MPPTELIANPALFNLEIQALREGVQVMQTQGIRGVKLPGYPVDWLVRILGAGWLPLPLVRTLLRPAMSSGRGSKMPSLHIDLAAGRDTSEVDALNGAIVEAGQRLGISTPVNQALTTILNDLVSGQVEWSEYRQQPERLLAAIKNRSYAVGG
jgi:2-dehydropantoate 2-reductase